MSKFISLINKIQGSRVSVIFILAGQIIMVLVMIVSAIQLEGAFKAITVIGNRLSALESSSQRLSIVEGHFITESDTVYLVIDKFDDNNFNAWLKVIADVEDLNRIAIGCLNKGEFESAVLIDKSIENLIVTGNASQTKFVVIYSFSPNTSKDACVNSVIKAVYVWED